MSFFRQNFKNVFKKGFFFQNLKQLKHSRKAKTAWAGGRSDFCLALTQLSRVSQRPGALKTCRQPVFNIASAFSSWKLGKCFICIHSVLHTFVPTFFQFHFRLLPEEKLNLVQQIEKLQAKIEKISSCKP